MNDVKMQREMILQRLKEQGCRITKQRLALIDIILENECSSCKEIYYKAIKKDPAIGIATVYRMVRSLEDIGAIRRNKMYEIQYGKERIEENALAEFGVGCCWEIPEFSGMDSGLKGA